MRRVLRWTGLALFAGGVAMLAYCGFVLMDARVFQSRERHHLDRLLTSPRASVTSPTGLIGRIEIPRLLRRSKKAWGQPLSVAPSAIFPAQRCRDSRGTWVLPATATRSFGP